MNQPLSTNSIMASRYLDSALAAAVERGVSGELLVRKPELNSRVLIVGNKIAWVHCHGHRGFLIDAVVQDLGLERDDLAHLLDECRLKRRAFGDYLVELGVVAEPKMRQLLLNHTKSQLDHTRSARGRAEILFMPDERAAKSRFTFTLSDLEIEVSHLCRPARETPNMQAAVRDLMDIVGAGAAAVVDPATGEALCTSGADRTHAMRGLAQLAAAQEDGSAQIEDVLITSAGEHRLVRPFGNTGLFFCLIVSRETGNLALARRKLSDVVNQLAL